MSDHQFLPFTAKIEIIGINPFVFLPKPILLTLMEQAQTDRGKIRVILKMEGFEFTQTLVKYQGEWRLYLNIPMRKAAKKEVGDKARFEIKFNPRSAEHPVSPELQEVLAKNKKAKKIFQSLSPSLQNEIMRYIFKVKSEKSKTDNVERVILYLLGKGKFLGREMTKKL